ncbi:MAG: glycosyltransferase [Planctomycetota bacterium]
MSRGAWILLGLALLLRVPFFFWDFHSNDLYRYVWEGQIQWQDANPYAVSPDTAPPALRGPKHDRINHPDLSTIYPPLAQYAFAAVAGLGGAEYAMRNVVVALDMLLCALLTLWLARRGLPPWWGALYLLHPLALLTAGSGHIDALMLLMLVGCCWSREAGRHRTAALFLAGAVLAKTVAVLALPWFLLRRPKETALVTLPAIALGYLPFLEADVLATLVRFGSEFAFNASLYRFLEWVVPGHGTLASAALLAVWVAVVTVSQPRVAPAFLMLFTGLLVLSPTVHVWYLSWLIVFLPRVGPRPWTWPVLTWSCTCLLVCVTYVTFYRGAPFSERWWITIVEYAVPAVVAVGVLVAYRPRAARVEQPRRGAPGSFGVVIPARGERENLEVLLPRWLDTPVEKIVVADTPTGDGTRELCRLDLRVRYLRVEERGYGAAVQAGLAKLRGEVDYAVICDADHADGPRQVEALLAPFRDRSVGLVCAARRRTKHLSAPQRLGNALACFLIALGWGRRFEDLGPFRALRVSMWPADALRDKSFGWNVEMNVRALERGMDVVEVELPAGERPFGENQISGTLRGVVGAGWGILTKLYVLREESCGRPSSS